jgi:branched-chain amino acid transport system substrate-binding protein
MHKRLFLRTAVVALAAAITGLHATHAAAEESKFKIGLVLPMTGPFASTGKQIEAGARAYMAQHGDKVGGRQIELILKDDAGVAANTKRLAQELAVNDKVNVLAGFGLTPLALAVAPIATQTKTPMIIMAAQTLSIIEASPYIVRTSGTIPQVTMGTAEWAAKNGIKKVVTLVPDYAPGYESEKAFKETFSKAGGEIVGEVRVPMKNPDFAPFLQKVRDLKPDALYAMLPSGPGAALLTQFAARGMDKAGIRLIAHGAVTDDDNLNEAGDAAVGIISSDYYSAAHPSPMNKKFVEDFAKLSKGARPNFFGVAGYDGMHLVYEAIKATKGAGNGDALLAAMKGQSFESPRGPVTLDPQSRDFVQNIYVRKVSRVNGQLHNVEFETIKDVLNTGKRK